MILCIIMGNMRTGAHCAFFQFSFFIFKNNGRICMNQKIKYAALWIPHRYQVR